MIVVDTNLIVYLHVTGEWSERAEQASRKDPHWSAPRLWRSEFCNVMTLYIRNRHLTLEAAQRIMAEALGLMVGAEQEVNSLRVLELTAASGCSAYDCEFVALAQDLGVRLVTVDKQVLRQFPDVATALDEFVVSQSRDCRSHPRSSGYRRHTADPRGRL
jgi:predicted nucleic acid-binding protein